MPYEVSTKFCWQMICLKYLLVHLFLSFGWLLLFIMYEGPGNLTITEIYSNRFPLAGGSMEECTLDAQGCLLILMLHKFIHFHLSGCTGPLETEYFCLLNGLMIRKILVL